MRLQYGIDGNAKLEDATAYLSRFECKIIEIVQDRLRLKIATLGFACKCDHECRLQAGDSQEIDDYETFLYNTICPEAFREQYPNCAHNERAGRDPDPFGEEIRDLISLSVLDLDEWEQWLKEIRERIGVIDKLVSNSLGGELFGTIPLTAPAEELQEPNLVLLREIGALLLKITDQALEEAV